MQVVPNTDIVYSLEGKAAGEVHIHSSKSPLPLSGRECVLLGHSSEGQHHLQPTAIHCRRMTSISVEASVCVCTHTCVWKCERSQPDVIGDPGQSSQNTQDQFLFPRDRIIHGMEAERAMKIISLHSQ